MQQVLDAFVASAGGHPAAALAFIGIVALAESLAVVGTLVPAGIVMFGAGVLAGHGAIGLVSTLAVAAAGAVAGDALSYELGRRHKERIGAWRLFRRYAGVIGRAEDLISRHGAVSVVIARFTGAVRAFVPLLAGFARMPAGRFYATNLLSALLWAPAHILPGVVFGASLHLAEQASGRLVALAVLLAALVWAATWLARFTIRTAVPLLRAARVRALRAAAGRSCWWARLMHVMLDPERPGSQSLLAGLAVLLGSMWLFLGIVEDVVSRDPLVFADQAVFTFLQQLRTGPVDLLMVAITEMGSVGVMLPLIVVIAAALAWQRCWRTVAYWTATAASAEIVVQVLKRTLGRHRPLALYQGVEQYSFPSGHATISAVVIAYLAFLLTRGQSLRWRIAIAATAAVYVALVGFSRLYLGAHWLSDVLGGFSFGLAAVALSAMVYSQRRVEESIRPKRLAFVAGATLVIAGSVWAWWHGPADRQRYAATTVPVQTTIQAWTDGGFRLIPAARHEFAGERDEAFTLQVACTAPALHDALRRAGWVHAPALSLGSVLRAVAPHPAVGDLPLLPKLDGGQASSINLIQTPVPGAGARQVLRLWQSRWQVASGVPIWYGTFYSEIQVRPNYSFLRQRAQAPTAYGAALVSAGLRRADGKAPGDPRKPELWMCGG